MRIKFVPDNKTVEVPDGTSLLGAATQAGVEVEATCGGKGTCGKCRVKILSGNSGVHTSSETKRLLAAELAEGWALACRHVVSEDMIVEIRTNKEVLERKIDLDNPLATVEANPAVSKALVVLEPPTLHDARADLERLLDSLPGIEEKPRLTLLQTLPGTLRQSDYRLTAVLRGRELLSVEQGDTSGRAFGVAFDIGTTTLVVSLLDLQSGHLLATGAGTNPQKAFGADVISRINHAAASPAALKTLQLLVIGELNAIMLKLFAQAGVRREEVYEAVAVGNTTMSHLFLGVDPSHLAPAPFIPAFRNTVDVSARELELQINPAGRVLVLPNIAGYVGSDTVGVMLACRLDEGDEIRLAIDIGTNGEVILAGRGRILTCSTAAGPAFEGAQIKDGMRAAEGAIEAVAVEDGEVKLKVIGDTLPKGICGSGLVDAVAALGKAGIMDASGRVLNPENTLEPGVPLAGRLSRGAAGTDFILVPASQSAEGNDIVISQKDIRELQLAKGAIHAGVSILLREMGVGVDDISQVLLAGAFGNYISKESALAIGLLPAVPLAKVLSVGNAAGVGARLALISKEERSRALKLAREAEHVELSGRADFQDEFVASLTFPKEPRE